MGIRRPAFYYLVGVAMWIAVLKSGIHSTIAGVLLAMAIPASRRIDEAAFVARGQALLDEFAARARQRGDTSVSPEQFHTVQQIERACEQMTPPLQRLEHGLHPWVAFGIMPLFALANAGVAIDADAARHAATDAGAIGIFMGLLVGKQLGVFAFAWLAVRAGLARLPSGATWKQLYGVACLCGIGFTMSLFIAGLAFPTPRVLDDAKLAVLAASAMSALLGAVILLKRRNAAG
jgi:NhaA family Na+:H+ antiporter